MHNIIINSVYNNGMDSQKENQKSSISIDESILRTTKLVQNILFDLTNFKDLNPPKCHYKCRYDPSDYNCKIELFTRTTDINVNIIKELLFQCDY